MWWWESVAWGSRCHGVGNVRPCWWGPGLFPEARNGASLRGCSWGGYLGWCSRNNNGAALWGPLNYYSRGSQQLGWHILCSCSSEATLVCGDRSGSGANWWRRSQSQVVKWPCAWQPTQRRTPDSHRHPPPTSLCSSRMMCERVPSAPKCE